MKSQRYNPKFHHRRSLRLPTYNYASSGAYFITICTVQHHPLFEIAELRNILEEQWLALPQRFAGVTLDAFVVMPNHVHFIVWLDAEVESVPTLGELVGNYKSLTIGAWLQYMKTAGLTHPGLFWQRNYFERIIRSELELQEKRTYIHNNPRVKELKKNGQQIHL